MKFLVKNYASQGYLTLMSILIITAFIGLVSVGIITTGNIRIQTTGSIVTGLQARGLAELCGELAIQQVIALESFTGNGSHSDTLGNCNYSVSGSSSEKTITASATVQQSTKHIQIIIDPTTIQPDGTITTVSWEEIVQ